MGLTPRTCPGHVVQKRERVRLTLHHDTPRAHLGIAAARRVCWARAQRARPQGRHSHPLQHTATGKRAHHCATAAAAHQVGDAGSPAASMAAGVLWEFGGKFTGLGRGHPRDRVLCHARPAQSWACGEGRLWKAQGRMLGCMCQHRSRGRVPRPRWVLTWGSSAPRSQAGRHAAAQPTRHDGGVGVAAVEHLAGVLGRLAPHRDHDLHRASEDGGDLRGSAAGTAWRCGAAGRAHAAWCMDGGFPASASCPAVLPRSA